MRTSGIRVQPSARIEPPRPAPIRAAVSREARKPASTPSATTARAAPHPLVVEGERAEPAGRRRVGGHVHLRRAVTQGAEVAGRKLVPA